MIHFRLNIQSLYLFLSLFLISCMNTHDKNTIVSNISSGVLETTLTQMKARFPQADAPLMERGVQQVAALWRTSDGTESEFTTFCIEQFAPDANARELLFNKLSQARELFMGGYNKMSVALQLPMHLEGPPLTPIDILLGSYSVAAHYYDDMFANKLAFITILNFPNFSLHEKNESGASRSRVEWAYARMGDLFTHRLPASVSQEMAKAGSVAENYIAEYNIMMGHLLDEQGQRLFPADMVLLSHWNLRDELKSNYAPVPNALAKQQMIYKVMTRIVEQTIPKEVINNAEYDWAPESNQLYQAGKEVTGTPEGERRYAILLDQYQAALKADPFYPTKNSALLRAFDGGMEISFEEIESMFIEYISSPQVKEVAALIKKRLNRDLQPFDIWYDGFKARSGLSEEMLSTKTTNAIPRRRLMKMIYPTC